MYYGYVGDGEMVFWTSSPERKPPLADHWTIWDTLSSEVENIIDALEHNDRVLLVWKSLQRVPRRHWDPGTNTAAISHADTAELKDNDE